MRHPAISYYPLAANLKGRLAVVVGGGRVAEHKIKKLLETEAKIKVVSPLITPALKCLVSDGKITWISRIAQSSDLHSADIAVAATPSSSINKAISRWARKQGVWVNVVDNPGLSDFISPAVFRRGKALIAVYTNGMDPALSRDLKNFLKENWSVFLSYRSRL
jgi:precorrin-2 dehydrogenase/sirohydrochlorin ferrochelatase